MACSWRLRAVLIFDNHQAQIDRRTLRQLLCRRNKPTRATVKKLIELKPEDRKSKRRPEESSRVHSHSYIILLPFQAQACMSPARESKQITSPHHTILHSYCNSHDRFGSTIYIYLQNGEARTECVREDGE